MNSPPENANACKPLNFFLPFFLYSFHLRFMISLSMTLKSIVPIYILNSSTIHSFNKYSPKRKYVFNTVLSFSNELWIREQRFHLWRSLQTNRGETITTNSVMVDSLNVTDSLQICSGKQSDNHYEGKVDLEARFLWRYFIEFTFQAFKHFI